MTTTTPPPAPPPPRFSSPGSDRGGGPGAGRVLGIAALALALLAALAVLLGGLGLLSAHTFARNTDDFFSASLDDFVSSGAAIRSDDLDLDGDPGPEWILDRVDATVRIEAEPVDPDKEVFIGIANADDLDRYLNGVAHDVVASVDGGTPSYDFRSGTAADAPVAQTFWVESVTGPGSQLLEWDVETGNWAAVLMNSDGSLGISDEVRVGLATDILLPVGLGLVVAGLLGVFLTIPLIGILARSARRRSHPDAVDEVVGSQTSSRPNPVRLEARLDTPLSPWLWLVKWLLAIPHFVVLVFLWIGFAIATVIAFFSILFTGRYPSALFAYTTGVLRWSWRVSYYAATGGLGTDRYPPFSLGEEPGYPATLTIGEPGVLSRGQVLVKWWLLAIPHYVVLAFVAGWGSAGLMQQQNGNWSWGIAGSMLGALTLIAGGFMLFTRRYPSGLFDLIIGLNRWVYRVIAYVALMTDEYPPFRLDQGGTEIDRGDPDPGGGGPDVIELDDVGRGRVLKGSTT